MFIAHLPAGYILTRALPRLRRHKFWVLAGSILPDADLLLIFSGLGPMVHHHNYLTHRPAFWLMLLALGIVLGLRGGILRALAAGGVCHVMLDTVTGRIDWGWPLIDLQHALITVPATQDWWVLSFLTHWSFGVELMICLCAGVMLCCEYLRGKRKG